MRDMAAIAQFQKGLDLFKELSPTITTLQVVFILDIASHEGRSLAEIAESTGIKMTTASRYLRELSAHKSANGFSPGIVHGFRDPKNRRRKCIVLTPRGQMFMERLNGG